MQKIEKITIAKHLFCEDCITDYEINCPRDKDVICMNMKCRKELCGYHMLKHIHTVFKCKHCNVILGVEDMAKHLEEKHLVSTEWRGI